MMHHFDTELAKVVGIPAAVLFDNICHWVKKNAANNLNIFEGKAWTYNSWSAFEQQFDYMSARSIRFALDKLKSNGFIVTGNFSKNPMDRTLWYALGEDGERYIKQRESAVCIPQNPHLTKLSNAFDKNGESITDIKHTDNNTPIGTPVPTVNNNLCDNGISSGILQRTYAHAQDGSSSSTGNSHTRTHACAQEKQQEKKIQTIKFDYDDSWHFVGITDRHIAYWQEHHPNIDVKGELTRMEMWLITHRDQRKKRIEVFINSWLSRAGQERRNNNGSNGDSQNNRPTGKTERINPEDFATKHIIPSSEQYDEALRRDKFFQSGIIPF